MRILDRKEKHSYHDHDDLDYYGIRDIESLLDKVDEEDCYRPILAKKKYKSILAKKYKPILAESSFKEL